MTTDTQIRHVTKPGAKLFREPGFAPDEAERCQAEINAAATMIDFHQGREAFPPHD